MATDAYMSARKKYGRPQGVLFSNNPGILSESNKYIPDGYEFGATGYDTEAEFLILSDDNRSPIDFKPTRIESRKRMINGRMRSYYIGDKLTLNLSWKMLPSRSFLGYPDFDTSTGVATNTVSHTSDGGAGGVELLRWYEEHSGPFYVFLSYDKYSNFDDEGTVDKYTHLPEYNQVLEMYIASFDYSIQKRGNNTDDFWDISMSLEEV